MENEANNSRPTELGGINDEYRGVRRVPGTPYWMVSIQYQSAVAALGDVVWWGGKNTAPVAGKGVLVVPPLFIIHGLLSSPLTSLVRSCFPCKTRAIMSTVPAWSQRAGPSNLLRPRPMAISEIKQPPDTAQEWRVLANGPVEEQKNESTTNKCQRLFGSNYLKHYIRKKKHFAF